MAHLMKIAATFSIVNALNDRINIYFMDIPKNEYSAENMYIAIIIVFVFVTNGTTF